MAAALEEEVNKLASSNTPANLVAAVNLMSALERRAVVSRAAKKEKIIDFALLPSSLEAEVPYEVEEELIEYEDDEEVEGGDKIEEVDKPDGGAAEKPEGGGGPANSHTGLSGALGGVALGKS